MENRIVYLSFKRGDGTDVYERYQKYLTDFGSLVAFSIGGKFACVTTTINCIKVNGWEDDLDFEVNEPTYHQQFHDAIINVY